MDTLKERQTELKRQAQTASIEARCISLKPGQKLSEKVIDLQTYQRIRIRLSRNKNINTRVELIGDNCVVTRLN
ncbi:MAG: hypothetical protein FWD66_00910 [Paludibacter sp.]|nr:hypothetical protein [Paludibacter sp.]